MIWIIPMALVLAMTACRSTPPSLPTTPVPIPKEESTLAWNPNHEPDMADYVVYACWTHGCDDLKAVGTVTHSTKPEFKVYIVGKAGALAVTARNTAGLESEKSETLRFDKR